MNWLFLRGLTREQRHWGDFCEVFESKVPGAKVFRLDMPGVGTEYSRESPKDMKDIAADIRTRWLELRAKTEGEWNLLSISLGAMAGMLWVSQYPNDFARLVLINTSAGNLNNPFLRLRGQMLGPLLRAAAHRDPLDKEREILRMTTNKSESEVHETAHEWANYSREYPMNFRVAFAQLAAAVLFRAPARIEIPTLILSSAKDRFTSPLCSRNLANFYKAPIEIHPHAGHDLPLEDSAWVSEKISAWMQTSKARETPNANP